ncbi:hypothetical protein HK098_004757 [Nowakowskiella sp. JEL0407]|nr:hypothetical protein HK098_004757 [Nowakowskiella sp. JEL0407]
MKAMLLKWFANLRIYVLQFIQRLIVRTFYPAIMSKENIKISEMYIYPVKSCRGIKVSRWPIGINGLELDRLWMVVDTNGKFITQREYPKLVLIECELIIDGVFVSDSSYSTDFTDLYDRGGKLVLKAPGMEEVSISFRKTSSFYEPEDVLIWGKLVKAIDEGDTISSWLSKYLGFSCRLVLKDPRTPRLLNPKNTPDLSLFNHKPPQTAFADGYPMLLVSDASLHDVNLKMRGRNVHTSWNGPVSVKNFRANILVSGLGPFEEEKILRFKMICGGESEDVEFIVNARCTRCLVPNNNVGNGENSGSEPFKTLMNYRRVDPGDKYAPVFGINVTSLKAGKILMVGSQMKVISVGSHDRRGIWRGKLIPIQDPKEIERSFEKN